MSVGYSKGNMWKRIGAPIPGLRERLACYGWGEGRGVRVDEVLSQGESSHESSRGGL